MAEGVIEAKRTKPAAGGLKIDLRALGDPIYRGSVQNLYAVPGRDDCMVCETTAGGSVFDVGTIFAIPNSDLTRAIFRHRVFTDLGNPACIAALVGDLRSGGGGTTLPAEWLGQAWVDRACREGIRTHHLGMVDGGTGEVAEGAFPATPSACNVVKRFRIIKPELVRLAFGFAYDYTPYQGRDGFVIPLEFIVRLGITSQSSVYRKYLKLGEPERHAYARSLGAGDELKAWEYFPRPIYDLTTKYEPEDRNLDNQEALLISTLTGGQFNENILTAILCTAQVERLLAGMGLRLWDIKWEFAKAGGALYLVDTVDTDSLRATFTVEESDGRYIMHFNKQSMRDYYRIAHGEWLDGVNAAKKAAAGKGMAFTELLKERQKKGDCPPTPEVDPAFLGLQTRKMDVISQYLLGNAGGEATQGAVKALAGEELRYYRKGGHFDRFAELNRI